MNEEPKHGYGLTLEQQTHLRKVILHWLSSPSIIDFGCSVSNSSEVAIYDWVRRQCSLPVPTRHETAIELKRFVKMGLISYNVERDVYEIL